jgi:hypothetical protein
MIANAFISKLPEMVCSVSKFCLLQYLETSPTFAMVETWQTEIQLLQLHTHAIRVARETANESVAVFVGCG